MNRASLLYKLDDLMKICRACDRKDDFNNSVSPETICKGCGTYTEIREAGRQLENMNRERKPMEAQKMVLEESSYKKLKIQGKSDADIAKQFGIKQPTLIYYKKKWEKEAVKAEKPAETAKAAAAITIQKLKQPEPVKSETKEPETKPSQTPIQPDIAVVKAPEPKPIGEAINDALNEAFAEKSAEYERLIAALRSDLTDAHRQLDERDEKIRNLEHLHDACEDCENEISSLQQAKEELERKLSLIQEATKQTNHNYLEATKKLKPLEEEKPGHAAADQKMGVGGKMNEGQWVMDKDTGNLGYVMQCSPLYHYVKFVQTRKGKKMDFTTWVDHYKVEPAPEETWVDETQIDLALATKDADYFYQLTGVRTDESK